MNIKREQVDKVLSRLDFDIPQLREQLRDKAPEEVDSPERIEKRKRSIAAEPGSAAEADRRFERIIQGNDLIDVNYLQKGLSAAKSVGRIQVCDPAGNVRGYGTGFLVAPGVLITNNHVLETSAGAKSSSVDFDYELDDRGVERVVSRFELEPSRLFVTSVALDFTVVAVAPISRPSGKDIGSYGWLQLIEELGKILVAEYVSIIQHPGGQRKQIAVRENKVLKIDPDVIWYATDTLQGSSGAPVLNNSWQVVALHHLGVPRTDSEGNWITLSGQAWDSSMDESSIEWIANEGIRVSRIVADLRAREPRHPLLQPIFNRVRPTTTPLSDTVGGGVEGPQSFGVDHREKGEHQASLTIASKAEEIKLSLPLNVTISLGDRAYLQQSMDGSNGEQQERISIDPDYSSRKGFTPGFLGEGARRVPLPSLSRGLLANVARLNGGTGFELKYHNFSVVMHAARRLAIFTAVNIDGKRWKQLARESDRWIYDPRISRSAQCGEELYARNSLDRGHLVRRLDPTWGDTDSVAKVANDDTFHFTNCSPQDKQFNQGKDLWAGLEDYILHNAANEDLRVNVFTGPVFRDDDREYRGVQIPAQYWKVVSAVGEDGTLYSAAYLISQSSLLRSLPQEFAYGTYSTFQVRVSDIEALTELDFGVLRDVDVFTGTGDLALRPRRQRSHESLPVEALGWRAITGFEQIQMPRGAISLGAPLSESRVSNFESQDTSRFSGNPKTEWLFSTEPDRDMKLLEEFSYKDPSGRRWIAPAGSIINGASIPRALWSSVGSPYTDDYRCASIVHDVACQDRSVARREADKMFYNACIAGGCSAHRAGILYAGVRIGAWASNTSELSLGLNEGMGVREIDLAPQDLALRRKLEEAALRIAAQPNEPDIDELERILDEVVDRGPAELTARTGSLYSTVR